MTETKWITQSSSNLLGLVPGQTKIIEDNWLENQPSAGHVSFWGFICNTEM